MTLCIEMMIVAALIAWTAGGLVTWQVMERGKIAYLIEELRKDRAARTASAAALGIFVGHIKGGQYWTPRMQKVYAAWKKEMDK